MTSPGLDGVRVLDFSQVMAGPYCTRLLAEHGADVIKVEPVEGEVLRLRPPLVEGRSRYFGQLNAGKRSLAVDLRHERVRAALRAIVANVHVVVENFRPGVLERHGLGATECLRVNPALVYCSISGYGQRGPDAQRPAVAPVIHAVSGLDAAIAHHLGIDRPAPTGVFTADVLAGALAFGAIGAALRGAERTGRGTHLDVGLIDSVLSMLVHEVQAAQSVEPVPSPAYEAVATADGYVMVAVVSDRHYSALCGAMERPELLDDERFSTLGTRRFNTVALCGEIETWSKERSASDVEARLNDVGVPCATYRTVGDWLHDGGQRARGRVREATDGSGSFLVSSGAPGRLDEEGRSAPPLVGVDEVSDLGAHSRSVLRELAGLSDSSIDALATVGAIR